MAALYFGDVYSKCFFFFFNSQLAECPERQVLRGAFCMSAILVDQLSLALFVRRALPEGGSPASSDVTSFTN